MIELLRAAAEEAPHRVALARAAGVMSYGELVNRAETVAAALRARGVQRLAVLDPDHGTVWALLAACSLAGVESCLYPVAATDETVAELRERLDHELLVTPRDLPGPGLLRPQELWAGTERDTGPVARRPPPAARAHLRHDQRPAPGRSARLVAHPPRDPAHQAHAPAALAAGLRAQPVRRTADAAARGRGPRHPGRRQVVPAARRSRGDASLRGHPRQRYADVLAVPARRAPDRRRARPEARAGDPRRRGGAVRGGRGAPQDLPAGAHLPALRSHRDGAQHQRPRRTRSGCRSASSTSPAARPSSGSSTASCGSARAPRCSATTTTSRCPTTAGALRVISSRWSATASTSAAARRRSSTSAA